MKVDTIILNYNGKELLGDFLPSVTAASENSEHDSRVIVLDNQSSDGSVEFVKQKYPNVKVVVARENKVLCSYNDAVKELDSDIVIFLNNDIKVDLHFIDPLIKYFMDKDIMFVAPRVMNFDGSYNGGKSYLEFKHGAMRVMVDFENYLAKGQTCSIACGAFRRSDFLELGGYDSLFLPGIGEDVDLCYRGILLGKKGIYEPESVIWHKESTTFHREFGQEKKMVLAHRGMFLFFWKNVRDPLMFFKHIILTPLRVLALLFKGETVVLKGLMEALVKIPEVFRSRKAFGRQISRRNVHGE